MDICRSPHCKRTTKDFIVSSSTPLLCILYFFSQFSKLTYLLNVDMAIIRMWHHNNSFSLFFGSYNYLAGCFVINSLPPSFYLTFPFPVVNTHLQLSKWIHNSPPPLTPPANKALLSLDKSTSNIILRELLSYGPET